MVNHLAIRATMVAHSSLLRRAIILPVNPARFLKQGDAVSSHNVDIVHMLRRTSVRRQYHVCPRVFFSSTAAPSSFRSVLALASTSAPAIPASRDLNKPQNKTRQYIQQKAAFTISGSTANLKMINDGVKSINNDNNGSTTVQPQFLLAKDVNMPTALQSLNQLIQEHDWTLDSTGTGISKTYWFKTYTKCLDFTQIIGIRSKATNHHSTIILKSGSVHVHWTTHHPRESISYKDLLMAEYCDEQAGIIGIVQRADAYRCGPSSSGTSVSA